MAADSVEAERSAGDDGGGVAAEGSVIVKTILAELKSVGAEGIVPVQGNLELYGRIPTNGSIGVESVGVEGSVEAKPMSLWERICLEYNMEQIKLPEPIKTDKPDETPSLSSLEEFPLDLTCLLEQHPAQRIPVLSPSKAYFELERTLSTASLESSPGLHVERGPTHLALTDLISLTDQHVAEPLSHLPASKIYFQRAQAVPSEEFKTDSQFGPSPSVEMHFRRELSQLAPAGSTRVSQATLTRVGPEGLTSVAEAGSTIVIDQPPQEQLPVLPDPKKCPTREYLETFIFPILLPGMDEMLREAYRQKCFERKRTKFIALDFLCQWLYNYNQKRKDQQSTDFFQIPFVAAWLKDHPRPPIPLSLLLEDEEAALIIQSFWRGYKVRRSPEVQELRQWHKSLKENEHIHEKVEDFWAKQAIKMGTSMSISETEHIPNHSGVSIQVLSPTPQNSVILT
ncbi:IQ domain-containing protein K isoform X2 [Lissotriton helveticus]